MITSQMMLVYGTYLLTTVSPGPSNMAIMATAMRDGRNPALVLASGVVTGSFFWAMLAATGMSAVLAAYADVLVIIKVLGGVYLLYLAFRTGRSAMQPDSNRVKMQTGQPPSRYAGLYRQGVLMHVGNPKAVLSWIAIMSLGLRQNAAADVLPAIIGGCALLGILVFGGYAVLFSTATMVAFCTRLRRVIEGGLCALFAIAGLELLSSGK